MEKGRGIANFVVRYNSNPLLVTGNHKPDIRDLLFVPDTDERNFDEREEAIIFLMECTSPITTLEQLVPELKGKKKFNYTLADRNIRPKHQLQASMDDFIDAEW